jgi:hypothetical protein
MANWIGKARASMERKGTVGAFGAATPAKIARGKRAGGKEEKRAVFAQNMKRIAERKSSRVSRRGGR